MASAEPADRSFKVRVMESDPYLSHSLVPGKDPRR